MVGHLTSFPERSTIADVFWELSQFLIN